MQPLLLAKTLLIIFLARILLLVARELGLEVVRWGLDAMDVSSSLLHALIGFGASVLAQLSSGLWVACLVLAIVAIVRSRDQLRTGAIMLLIALVVSSIFGFEVSGDFGSGRVSAALSVLERAFDLAAVIVSALGAFFLLRGCRSAARDAGPRYAVI